YVDETPPDPAELLEPVFAALTARGLDHLQLILEPGRSLVGNAGVLLTRVEYLKRTEARNFAIVDAAMNDLMRPALYDAWHGVVPVAPRAGTLTETYDIVGPICESGDWLARGRALPLEQGDLLAIQSAGAYAFSMSSQYNTRPRAAEVLVDGQDSWLVRPRGTGQGPDTLERTPHRPAKPPTRPRRPTTKPLTGDTAPKVSRFPDVNLPQSRFVPPETGTLPTSPFHGDQDASFQPACLPPPLRRRARLVVSAVFRHSRPAGAGTGRLPAAAAPLFQRRGPAIDDPLPARRRLARTDCGPAAVAATAHPSRPARRRRPGLAAGQPACRQQHRPGHPARAAGSRPSRRRAPVLADPEPARRRA